MVNLVQAMKLMDTYAQPSPSPPSCVGDNGFFVSLNERDNSFFFQRRSQGKLESNVAMLREGLHRLCSSPLALWIQLLRLPVLYFPFQRCCPYRGR